MSEAPKKLGRPKEWTKERVDPLAQDLLDWMNEDESRVYVSGWLVARGLYRQLIPEFQSVSKTFSAAYKKAQQIEEHRLAQRLITKGENVVGAIFALKNKSNWLDRPLETLQPSTTINISTSELKGLSTDAILEQMKKLTKDARPTSKN